MQLINEHSDRCAPNFPCFFGGGNERLQLDTPDPDAKEMYDRYSKDVKSKGLDKTRETAKNALQDGVSHENVTNMLKSQDSGYIMLTKTNTERLANKSLAQIVTNAQAQVKLSNLKQQQKLSQEKASSLLM